MDPGVCLDFFFFLNFLLVDFPLGARHRVNGVSGRFSCGLNSKGDPLNFLFGVLLF